MSDVAKAANAAVVATLKKQHNAISPAEMQSALRAANIPEAAARVAVIRLAESGQIRIRPDRRIELVTAE